MSAESIKLKEQQVAEYAEKFGKAKSVVLVDYRGLTVAEDTAMRNEMRKAGVEYKVVKNRLMARAFAAAGIPGFDVIEGPTAVAVSYDDAVAPSKIVATIPAKPVLVAQLLGMLQSPLRGLAVALSEIAKKKEA